MNVAYAHTALSKRIFLAGPSSRDASVLSWRPEALDILEDLGFSGTVFVPEDNDKASRLYTYDDQIEWELEALHSATVVVFWVPRNGDLPGFTTNIEFGMFATRPNVVLGCPPNAEKVKYLKSIANLYGIPVFSTLRNTLKEAISLTRRPFFTGNAVILD